MVADLSTNLWHRVGDRRPSHMSYCSCSRHSTSVAKRLKALTQRQRSSAMVSNAVICVPEGNLGYRSSCDRRQLFASQPSEAERDRAGIVWPDRAPDTATPMKRCPARLEPIIFYAAHRAEAIGIRDGARGGTGELPAPAQQPQLRLSVLPVKNLNQYSTGSRLLAHRRGGIFGCRRGLQIRVAHCVGEGPAAFLLAS